MFYAVRGCALISASARLAQECQWQQKQIDRQLVFGLSLFHLGDRSEIQAWGNKHEIQVRCPKTLTLLL